MKGVANVSHACSFVFCGSLHIQQLIQLHVYQGSFHNSRQVKVGKPFHRGGGSRILPGFSQLREAAKNTLRGGVPQNHGLRPQSTDPP